MGVREYSREIAFRTMRTKNILLSAWSDLCQSVKIERAIARMDNYDSENKGRRAHRLDASSRNRQTLFGKHSESRANMYAVVPEIRDDINYIQALVLSASETCSTKSVYPVTYRIRIARRNSERREGFDVSEPGVRVFIVGRSGSVYHSFEAMRQHFM